MSFSIPPDFCTTIVGHSRIIANSEPAKQSSPDGAVTAWVLACTDPRGNPQSKLSQGSVPPDSTLENGFSLDTPANGVRAWCCVDPLRPPDSPGVDWSLLIYNSFGFTRNAPRNTLETGWTVPPPPTTLAAKSKEFGRLQRDRVRTTAWFCGSLLLALSGRNQSAGSHSVVVERLSPARVGASSNWGHSRGSLLRCGSIP